MIMLVLEDLELEVIGVWYIHTTIKPEETVGVNGPAGIGGLGVSHVNGSQRVRGKCREDVIVEVLHVEHGGSPEYWSCKVCCLEGHSKLFLHKHWPEIVRVDASVVLIPLFGIDVPASSESIRFCTESTRAKADNHIKLGEELQPLGLLAGWEFSCCEVLEVLVVGNNVDQRCRAFQVVPPSLEGLMNGEQFLVVGVVVELWSRQSPRVVHDRANLLIWTTDGEDASNSIVGSMGLYNHWSVQNPVGKNWSRGEGGLKLLEGGVTGGTKVPWSTFAGESCQRSDDVGVIVNETMVEISES